MTTEHEVFENGKIRITRTVQNDVKTYTVTHDNFTQLVLDLKSWNNLKELILEFAVDEADKAIKNLNNAVQYNFDFDVQEGEYG